MRIYIAGPMGAFPDDEFNRKSFEIAWNKITQMGHIAISPHFLESTIDIETRSRIGMGQVYRYALPIDIFALSSCDGAIALPGWHDSRGSRVEEHVSRLMEIPWDVGNQYDSPQNHAPTGPPKNDDEKHALEMYIHECVKSLENRLKEKTDA
tara:strand:+ start:4973 stop:5428 length:456 start_codon:yes stop_codon:yes gene_type:complete